MWANGVVNNQTGPSLTFHCCSIESLGWCGSFDRMGPFLIGWIDCATLSSLYWVYGFWDFFFKQYPRLLIATYVEKDSLCYWKVDNPMKEFPHSSFSIVFFFSLLELLTAPCRSGGGEFLPSLIGFWLDLPGSFYGGFYRVFTGGFAFL